MLCFSCSLDPEFYSSDIIDRIISVGNDLVAECDKSCFIDFDLCNDTICTEVVSWNFELNNTKANVRMEFFDRGIISNNPCLLPTLDQTIEEFFELYSMGILVTPCFVTALWKERGEFFIFYPCPIKKVGRTLKRREFDFHQESTKLPSLVILKSIKNLCQNVTRNIDKAQHCKPFEIRNCIIEMTDLSEEGCDPNIRRIVEDEMITKAMMLNSKGEIPEESPTSTKEMTNEDRENLIKQIKRKKNSEMGFIGFLNGELMCGRTSKDSKVMHPTARKNHVSQYKSHLKSRHLVKFRVFCLQAGAICTMSVAVSCLRNLNCWNGELIDCVVMSGHDLYMESSLGKPTRKMSICNQIKSFF